MEIKTDLNSEDSSQLAEFLLMVLDQQQEHFFPDYQTIDKSVALAAYSGTELVGGLLGKIIDQSLNVSLLAIDPKHQKDGLGSQLIEEVEKIAAKNQVINLLLSTRSYQALAFYQKNNFEIYGELKDMPFRGFDKYYLVKRLMA